MVTRVGLAWMVTALAVSQCNLVASLTRIEAPNWWFDIGAITPTVPLLSALILMLWLQREAAWRFVFIMGAALSFLFCFLGVHALWWLATRLFFADLRPIFARVASSMLWQEILLAAIAVTLSLVSLFLCIRASRRVDEAWLKSARNWQTASSP